MHGHTEYSLAPRITVTIGHGAVVAAAFWVLVGGGADMLAGWLGATWSDGDALRRWVLVAFSVIYMVRAFVGMFVFLRRRFDGSEAAIVLGLFFVLHATFAILGASSTAPLSWLDGVAVALYAIGSYFNTGSEYSRWVWKKDPANRGLLYTEGLFGYSMHINYFGDTLLFTGFAMLTRSPWAFLVPALMTLGFLLQHIPTLDRYLRDKYGQQFDEYAGTTKRFVPFVY